MIQLIPDPQPLWPLWPQFVVIGFYVIGLIYNGYGLIAYYESQRITHSVQLIYSTAFMIVLGFGGFWDTMN